MDTLLIPTIQEWAAEHDVSLKSSRAPHTSAPVTAGPPLRADDSTDNIMSGHDEIVWALEVANGRLFSASADKTIRVWDVASRRCVQVCEQHACTRCITFPRQVLEDHARPVLSLAIHDDHLFSGSYDFTIRVWDLRTLTRVKTLQGHTDAVRSLAIANGRLFSGSYDGMVKVWSIESLTLLKTLHGHTGPLRTLAHSGRFMFSGSYDKSVRVWDVESLECVATLQGHQGVWMLDKEGVGIHVCGVPAPPGGKMMITVSQTTTACSNPPPISPGAVRALVATPTRVFSGSDDTTVRVWDSESLRCLRTLEGHEDNVRVLAVSERYLFSGSWDKTIRVWDLQTLSCVKVRGAEVVLRWC